MGKGETIDSYIMWFINQYLTSILCYDVQRLVSEWLYVFREKPPKKTKTKQNIKKHEFHSSNKK